MNTSLPRYSPRRFLIILLFAASAVSSCVARSSPAAKLDPPPAEELVRVSKIIAGLTFQKSGATYNLYDGSLAGDSSYAVSIYPDREQEVEGYPGPGRIHDFIQRNIDVLCSRDRHVGTWVNQALGRTYLDISTNVPGLEQAKALGRQYQQSSVFDLKNGQEVPVE